MNQQETIEEIANLIAPYFKDPIDITCPYCKAAEALYNAGLRFVPKEIPLISYDDVLIWAEKHGYSRLDVSEPGLWTGTISKLAQRDLCRKALEGE